MEGLSDRGSIPLRSTDYTESELNEFGFCAFYSRKKRREWGGVHKPDFQSVHDERLSAIPFHPSSYLLSFIKYYKIKNERKLCEIRLERADFKIFGNCLLFRQGKRQLLFYQWEGNEGMDQEALKRLERLNKLRLTEEETAAMLDYFQMQRRELESLHAVNTEQVERMVHVMPMTNIIREDKASQPFTREELQEGAPESYDGYWQVPRLVD